MWSFHGASIKWGKDDVLPITSKFSQENPFGAPVETKDDLGRVGGGIPVVAFWTRGVGEALGQGETIPPMPDSGANWKPTAMSTSCDLLQHPPARRDLFHSSRFRSGLLGRLLRAPKYLVEDCGPRGPVAPLQQ